MGTEKYSKINNLFHLWPHQCILTSTALIEKGYSYELIHKYKNHNWLTPIGPGSYLLPGTTVTWSGALYAIQTQLKLDIHIAGLTALYLKGYAHYISPNAFDDTLSAVAGKSASPSTKQRFFLFGSPGVQLPTWFKNFDWSINFNFCTTNLFPENCRAGFTDYAKNHFSIRMSSPERAILEMLYLVPFKASFDEAFKIMETLITLRPSVIQNLLDACSSIKAKRLFLFMAEKHRLPWFKKLDLSKIYLGKGNREIVRNGVLDKKYLITVPKSLAKG